jgi:hypothetical protein
VRRLDACVVAALLAALFLAACALSTRAGYLITYVEAAPDQPYPPPALDGAAHPRVWMWMDKDGAIVWSKVCPGETKEQVMADDAKRNSEELPATSTVEGLRYQFMVTTDSFYDVVCE